MLIQSYLAANNSTTDYMNVIIDGVYFTHVEYAHERYSREICSKYLLQKRSIELRLQGTKCTNAELWLLGYRRLGTNK